MRRVALLIVLAAATLPLRALAAPAADLWPFWDRHDAASDTTVDHAAWQALLDRYLRSADDGINRFAYADVGDADRQQLRAYLDRLAALDPRTLARDEQMAYWINLYNALTVEVVLRNPDKGSILRMGEGFFSVGPWNDDLLVIAGQDVTLNDIEHRILRPIWQDHRIHYAVNCASLGCPDLATEAYTAANLERLLDAGEQAYINHPRGVRIDDRGRLVLSEIFKWYRVDFAADEAGLLRHLAERHATLGERLRGWDGQVRYAYDWDLNRP